MLTVVPAMASEKLSSVILERRRRVAANIKRLRKARNIRTQEDLAAQIGMDRSYIGRLESCNAPFGSELEERFAQFFGVDIQEFYRPAQDSPFERDMVMLREDLAKYGGADAIRRLRQMLPLIFEPSSTYGTKEGAAVPAAREKRRKRHKPA